MSGDVFGVNVVIISTPGYGFFIVYFTGLMHALLQIYAYRNKLLYAVSTF